MSRIALVAALAAAGLATSSASALNVVLDYSNDTGYFAANPAAKATLARAASDLNALITTKLNATVDTNSATNGQTTATYDYLLGYKNPSLGTAVTLNDAAIPLDEFRIYVGRQNLSGATLAQGGPGGLGFSLGGTGFLSEWSGALVPATAAANANVRRGGGPTFGTQSGTSNGTPYSVTYGALLGNLWFDSDVTNDGVADADSVVNDFFQTDYTQAVGAGQIDLYSVALHEMLHSLGIGTSLSWQQDIGGDGNDWTGANGVALIGAGDNNLVSDGHDHINGSYASTVYGTGTAQMPVMIPSIGFGERRYLTTLDAAFLQDIGWSVVAVPEPTTLAMASFAIVGLARRRRTIG